MANQINYKINFETNTKELDQTLQYLREIQNIKLPEFSKTSNSSYKEAQHELVAIKDTAREVEKALGDAFDSDLGTYNITKLRGSIGNIGLDKVYKSLTQIKDVGPKAFENLSTSLLTTNLQMKESNKLLNNMAQGFKKTVGWGISSSVWNTMTNSLEKAWEYTKKLDTSLNDIRIVSNKTANEMERFAKSANKAAKELGTSTLDYTKAALIYYQQGIESTEEISERTAATLKLANTTGESASTVSDYMTAIWNNFEDGSHTIEYYADVLAKLGAETASSSDEIAQGLEKFASVAETVGLSYEYATSALTTITAATRQSADTVGTALKTLFSRIQDLELGETLDDGTTLGQYSEALEKVGISIKTQNGELKDMDDILDEMGKKWKTLNNAQQVALAQAVAGTRQYNQLMALMNNWSDMEKNITRASTAAGTLNEQQSIYLESTQAHLEQLGTAAERVMDAFVDNKGINSLIDDATSLTTIFANFVESIGGGSNLLRLFGSIGTQVFSTQIANGIAMTIKNIDKARYNTELFINDIEYLKSLKGTDAANEDPAYQAGLEAAMKFASIRKIMSKEEIDEANDLINEIIKVKKLEQAWESAKKKAIEYAQALTKNEKFGMGEDEKGNPVMSVSEEEVLILKDTLAESEQQVDTIDEIFYMIEKKVLSFNRNASKMTEKAFDEINKGLVSSADELLEEVKQFAERMDKTLDPKMLDDFVTAARNMSKKTIWARKDVDQETGKESYKMTANSKEQVEKFKNIFSNLTKLYSDKKGVIKDYLKQEWDSETNYTDELGNKFDKAGKKADAFKNKIDFKNQIKSTVDLCAGIGQISTALNALTNLDDIWNNDDLSVLEKTSQIIMSLSTAIPLLINGAKTIWISLGTIRKGILSVVAAHKAQEMSALKAWAATLGPIVLVVAAVAGLTAGIYLLVKAYNADLEAAKQAKQASEEAAEAANDAKEAYEELKTTLESYEDAIDVFEDLIVGTDEYTEALKTANEAAIDLIKTNESLAKYAKKDGNGLIVFEKDGKTMTSEEILSASNQKMNSSEAAATVAEVNYNRASLTNDRTNFLRKADMDVQETALKEALKSTATFFITPDKFKDSLESGKERMQGTLQNEQLEAVIDQLIADGGEEVFALGNLSQSLDKMGFLNEEQKKALEENSGDLEDLTKATIDLNATNKLLLEESLASSLENNSTYADLSDAEKNAVVSLYGEGLTEDKEQELRTQAEEKWNQDAAFGGGNEDEVHTAYAKAMGYTLSEDKSGDKAVYITADGEEKTVSDDSARAYLINQDVQKGLADYDTDSLNNIMSAVQKVDLEEVGSDYGADFRTAILQSIASDDKKIDMSSLFAQISPSEYSELMGMSAEEWQEALGLTDAEMETLGLGTAEDFKNNFQNAMEDWEFNIPDAAAAAIKTRSTEIEEEDLDSEEIQNYTQYLMELEDAEIKAGTESNGLANNLSEDADAAAIVAISVAKMNKGVDTLSSNWEEWGDVLKRSSKTSLEYANALSKTKGAMSDILDVEEDSISNSFIEDHLDEITKAAEGNEDAIDSLRTAYTDEIALNLSADLGLEGETLNKFNSLVDTLQNQIPDIKVGAVIDTNSTEEGYQSFLKTCQELIKTAGLTKDQANELFSAMGFEASFAEEDQDVSYKIPVTKTTHHRIITGRDALGQPTDWVDEETSETTYKDVEGDVPAYAIAFGSDGKQATPEIKSLTKKGTGVYNDSSTVNKGNTDSNSGSSTKNKSSDKKDRYQEVNNQLAETSATLKKIQSQTDKLMGGELVKNLNSQIETLNKNIDLTKKKLEIAQEEQNEYADALKNTYGVQFNEDGSINQSSYEAAFEREKARYEAASSDDEAAQERWENFKNAISEFNTLDTTIQGLIQGIIDDTNSKIEKQIEAFRVSFDVSLDLTEARENWNKFKKEVIDELADDNLLETLKSYGEDLSTLFQGDGSGALQQSTTRLKELMDIYEKMENGDTSTIYGDDKSKLIEDIEEAQEEVENNLTTWENKIDEIQGMYLKGLENVAEGFSDAIEDLTAITQTIDHEIKLMEYAKGDKSYKDQSKLYSDKVKAIQSQIDLQTKENGFWAQQLAIAETNLATFSKEEQTSEEYYTALSEYNKVKEEFENSTNELLSSYEDKMDALTSAYVANIEAVFEAFNEGLTNSMSLDEASEQWDLLNKSSEEYLDTVNGIYGIQSLANKYTEAINEQSVTAQQKLSKIMDSEIKSLREKDKLSQYDLDRADLRYQIALKQIALEEAQQNKTTLRLRRDSQGNYTYQYTQDEDEIGKLQGELSDLYNQLYNLDTEKYDGNLEKVYQLTAEYQDKYKEILQDASLADEEREQKILEITEKYGDLINDLTQQNEDIKSNLKESAMAELFDLYGQDTNNYNAMTEEQKGILNQYLNDEIDLTNSAYNTIFGIYDKNVEELKNMTDEEVNTLITSLVPGWTSAYQTIVTKLTEKGGFTDAMDEIKGTLLSQAEEYFSTINKDYDAANKKAEEHQDTIENITSKYDTLDADYKKLMEDIKNEQDTLLAFASTWAEAADSSKILAENTEKALEDLKASELIKSKEEEKKTEDLAEGSTTGDSGDSGTGGGSQSSTTPSLNIGSSVKIKSGVKWYENSYGGGKWGWAQPGTIKYINENGSHPYNIDGNGWIRKTDIEGYRTGGYTGDWSSSDGKLALLHQKELVLNEEDTKNILAAVDILRNITAANLQQLNANSNISGNGIEQNVHINATFPNVTSSGEIEEAFNNLINMAAQRVGR